MITLLFFSPFRVFLKCNKHVIGTADSFAIAVKKLQELETVAAVPCGGAGAAEDYDDDASEGTFYDAVDDVIGSL